jgi:DNA-binding transcriptional ArsR family regulator
MVEYIETLDTVFSSLADPTRRDILRRVSGREMTVGQIASYYTTSLAAISKHLKILEQAKLIRKRRRGRQQLVAANPTALRSVQDYIDDYQRLWERRFDALEELVKDYKENT